MTHLDQIRVAAIMRRSDVVGMRPCFAAIQGAMDAHVLAARRAWVEEEELIVHVGDRGFTAMIVIIDRVQEG